MTVDIKHYIEKYKEHEAKRLSTNERNAYWQRYQLEKKDQNDENV